MNEMGKILKTHEINDNEMIKQKFSGAGTLANCRSIKYHYFFPCGTMSGIRQTIENTMFNVHVAPWQNIMHIFVIVVMKHNTLQIIVANVFFVSHPCKMSLTGEKKLRDNL